MKRRFMYCAWFRDLRMRPGDQDYEWPACFLIEASTADEARGWGDSLSQDFSRRRVTEVFLSSEVTEPSTSDAEESSAPVVSVGYQATDEEIGW